MSSSHHVSARNGSMRCQRDRSAGRRLSHGPVAEESDSWRMKIASEPISSSIRPHSKAGVCLEGGTPLVTAAAVRARFDPRNEVESATPPTALAHGSGYSASAGPRLRLQRSLFPDGAGDTPDGPWGSRVGRITHCNAGVSPNRVRVSPMSRMDGTVRNGAGRSTRSGGGVASLPQ